MGWGIVGHCYIGLFYPHNYIGIGTLGICHDAYRHSIKSDTDFLKSAGIISTQLRIGMNGSKSDNFYFKPRDYNKKK